MKTFRLSDEDKDITKRVYDAVGDMINARNRTYTQFNDRNLIGYINDNQRRINSYVEPKESQGKEDWQSNVALPTIRDKMKRIISGFSLTVPELKVEARTATGDIDLKSIQREDIVDNLIKSSYSENNNPIIDHFWESWECGINGTVIVYEGYLKTIAEQKFIKEINMETGEVSFDTRKVNIDDKCVSHLLDLSEFFIRDFAINKVQDQRDCAWIKYYDPELFQYEFGKYKNAEHVKTYKKMLSSQVDTFYKEEEWKASSRAGENQIEVIRYYNKINDEYIIVANGIPILKAPLLWEVNGKKVYPFSKSILEPFVGMSFFYGKSLPDILMGQYDLLNTYFNSVMDKGFKNLNPPTLVGLRNKDAFDIEDELLSTNTKIYVDDVNQAKPMPIESVSQADVQMIQLLSQGIEESAPSMPSIIGDKAATAREVVIANERIQELKNVYHEMLVELWRQKFQLRLANIKMNYSQPRLIHKKNEEGESEVLEAYKTFIIENTIIDAETRKRGTLAIQFRDITEEERVELEKEFSAIEEAMEKKGRNFKKIILSSDYLDGYEYQIDVVPESLEKTSVARLQVGIQEEFQMLAAFFPEFFQANKEEYFRQFAEAYAKDPEDYIERFQEMMGSMRQQEQQMGGEVEDQEEGGGIQGPQIPME